LHKGHVDEEHDLHHKLSFWWKTRDLHQKKRTPAANLAMAATLFAIWTEEVMASIQIVVARISLLRVRNVKCPMRSVVRADHESEKKSQRSRLQGTKQKKIIKNIVSNEHSFIVHSNKCIFSVHRFGLQTHRNEYVIRIPTETTMFSNSGLLTSPHLPDSHAYTICSLTLLQ
jgi:hypothetical protein